MKLMGERWLALENFQQLRRFLRFASLLVALMALTGQGVRVRAAEEVAIRFLITASEVALQRENTLDARAIQQDAVALFGVGDKLITGERGRAVLDFSGVQTALLLPNSQLSFIAVSDETGTTTLHLHLDGHIIFDRPTPAANLIIRVETSYLTVSATKAIGIWANYENSDIVTTPVEPVRIDTGETFQTINAGEGIFVDETETQIVGLLDNGAPYVHAAQLIGILKGCPAIVTRTAGQSLNVRVGSNINTSPIGYVDENAAVALVGVNENGQWSRVQRFSGFGWIFTSYVDQLILECPERPTYPAVHFERNLELNELQPVEIRLIQPFYGIPESNPWVFRSLREAVYDDF